MLRDHPRNYLTEFFPAIFFTLLAATRFGAAARSIAHTKGLAVMRPADVLAPVPRCCIVVHVCPVPARAPRTRRDARAVLKRCRLHPASNYPVHLLFFHLSNHAHSRKFSTPAPSRAFAPPQVLVSLSHELYLFFTQTARSTPHQTYAITAPALHQLSQLHNTLLWRRLLLSCHNPSAIIRSEFLGDIFGITCELFASVPRRPTQSSVQIGDDAIPRSSSSQQRAAAPHTVCSN